MSVIENLEFDDYYLRNTKDEKEYEKQFPYIKYLYTIRTIISEDNVRENTLTENIDELENNNDSQENDADNDQEAETEENGPYFDLYDPFQREPTINII